MKTLSLRLDRPLRRALVAAVLLVAAGQRVPAAPPARPAAFPEVTLGKRSEPRYAAIELDSRVGGQVAYLLFDGTVSNGYDRVLVWSPGHEKYGKPVSLTGDSATGAFRPIVNESATERQKSLTTWNLRYRPENRGHNYMDYKSGQMVTNETRLTAIFYFSVDIQRGPARAADRGGRWPLDISIPGRLSVSGSWEKCPAPYAPWAHTYSTLSRTPVYERGRGFIRVRGGLRYWQDRWNNFPCVVRSVPEDTRVTIRLNQWLGKPAHHEAYRMEEIYDKDVEIAVPYGWYTLTWDFKSEFFSAPPLHANSEAWPFAFPPPES